MSLSSKILIVERTMAHKRGFLTSWNSKKIIINGTFRSRENPSVLSQRE